TLLTTKPRPAGWNAGRQGLDEFGSVPPGAADVNLTPIDAAGIPGGWSTVAGSDPSRVLLSFHGRSYSPGASPGARRRRSAARRRVVSEAGRAAKVRPLAIAYCLAPEPPFPAALDGALAAWLFLGQAGIAAGHTAIGGDSAGGGLTAALTNFLNATGEEGPGC